MTLAYTCVLIAIIMPLVWAMYCKTPHFKANDYDNNSPRPMLDKLEGRYQRANWAQQNSYESLPPFLAAVIIAHLVVFRRALSIFWRLSMSWLALPLAYFI